MNFLQSEPLSTSKNTSLLSYYAAKVQRALQEKNLESPIATLSEKLSHQQCYQAIQYHMHEILKALHLNLNHPDLEKTPHRIAKMYVHEIFSGLDYDCFPEPTFSSWENSTKNSNAMVSIGAVEFTSHCLHHFSIMQGKAKMTYIPKNKILGLSKVHRIFRFFASRPQLQELFTAQCLLAFQTILETEDVIVAVKANHGCVRSRGIRDSESLTETVHAGGCFSGDFELQKNFLLHAWN